VSAKDCRLEIRYLLSMMCDEPAPPQYAGLEICPTVDAIVVCVDKPALKKQTAPAVYICAMV
jgi:hypothetical protein